MADGSCLRRRAEALKKLTDETDLWALVVRGRHEASCIGDPWSSGMAPSALEKNVLILIPPSRICPSPHLFRHGAYDVNWYSFVFFVSKRAKVLSKH